MLMILPRWLFAISIFLKTCNCKYEAVEVFNYLHLVQVFFLFLLIINGSIALCWALAAIQFLDPLCTVVGIHHADHAARSINKSWH
jgi:hypothetical protein